MNFVDIVLEQRVTKDLPLPLREGETYQIRERIDELLNQHWSDRRAWLRGDHEQSKKFTYGEVTANGARQLIQFMELKQNLGENDSFWHQEPVIFYDLGSGAGKVVVQMFLENVTTASIGVELSRGRHCLAEQAWAKVQETLGLTTDETIYKSFINGHCVGKPRVRFVNQDFLHADFTDATHLYVSSLCFPEKLTHLISQIVVENRQEFGKLQVVASLSDLPLLEDEENRDCWEKTFERIQMTWGLSTARIYKYVG